jgi:hypothetical protein
MFENKENSRSAAVISGASKASGDPSIQQVGRIPLVIGIMIMAALIGVVLWSVDERQKAKASYSAPSDAFHKPLRDKND